MADATKNVLSLVATTSDRIKDLVIKNGQLVFIQDKGKIAFDFNDKRVFYNQITELETEQERTSISSPTVGYYFIIETSVLWSYQDDWVQITNPPEQSVIIGTEIPDLGQENKLYVNKLAKKISVWDNDINSYIVVSDVVNEISDKDIENLFD